MPCLFFFLVYLSIGHIYPKPRLLTSNAGTVPYVKFPSQERNTTGYNCPECQHTFIATTLPPNAGRVPSEIVQVKGGIQCEALRIAAVWRCFSFIFLWPHLLALFAKYVKLIFVAPNCLVLIRTNSSQQLQTTEYWLIHTGFLLLVPCLRSQQFSYRLLYASLVSSPLHWHHFPHDMRRNHMLQNGVGHCVFPVPHP